MTQKKAKPWDIHRNFGTAADSVNYTADVNDALGLLETLGYTPAMVALDVMEKSAPIRVLQAELNDLLGVIVKIAGDPSSVETAVAAGHAAAVQMSKDVVSDVIHHVDPEAWKAIESPAEFNPLIQQAVVHAAADTTTGVEPMSQALGFLETQGFTAVFDAVDAACKAAQVEVVGKEKLGGGYITVVIRGDVAAVHAAIAIGQQKAGELGTLIAAHVIPNPSPAVLGLLPG